jgi:acyl dehydratase
VHYLEDFAAGQVFTTGRYRVDKEQILAFAKQFDPQPFHTNEEAARKSPFQGLAASGWHTAAMTMRLMVDGEFKPAGGILGVGFEELSWPRPVRPGQERSAGSAAVEIAPGPRHDQGAHDDVQSKRRARDGFHRQSSSIASAV